MLPRKPPSLVLGGVEVREMTLVRCQFWRNGQLHYGVCGPKASGQHLTRMRHVTCDMWEGREQEQKKRNMCMCVYVYMLYICVDINACVYGTYGTLLSNSVIHLYLNLRFYFSTSNYDVSAVTNGWRMRPWLRQRSVTFVVFHDFTTQLHVRKHSLKLGSEIYTTFLWHKRIRKWYK